MRAAVIQSNYIPWKGYFDIINNCDVFVFHDDLQYTKNDWRNRNKIKTPSGPEWLTIPCGTNQNRLISEVQINEKRWQKQHFEKIKQNYSKANYWYFLESIMQDFLLDKKWDYLSDLNQYFIKKISLEIFNSKCEFIDSRTLKLTQKKSDRVLEICQKLKADYYISGPSAVSYLEAGDFERKISK